MVIAALIFGGWNWLWPAVGVFFLIAVLLVQGYRRVPTATAVRWLCPSLKVTGVAVLLLCFLDPLWSGQRARSGSNLFVLLADNSQGLQVKDRGAPLTRGEHLRDLLDPQHSSWQQSLYENFEVRRYCFDARLQTTKDFSELTFDGRSSALGAALRALGERFRGRPLAGILLLTDGIATDLTVPPDLTGLPPIYPVVIGSQDPIKDIAIQRVHSSQTDFEDAPVSIQADVAAVGFSGQRIVAQLLDVSGKSVVEQTIEARKGNDLLPFRFQFRPLKPGLSFYRLSIRSRDELGSSADRPERSEEATLANNSTVLAVNRGQEPHRILYISGRPNWEFKFLNRALSADDQLQLVGLIRVAKREPKFTFLGRVGESSNPLFRGFDNQFPEEVERFDQPVLKPPSTPGMPWSCAAVFRVPRRNFTPYHAVIVGRS